MEEGSWPGETPVLTASVTAPHSGLVGPWVLLLSGRPYLAPPATVGLGTGGSGARPHGHVPGSLRGAGKLPCVSDDARSTGELLLGYAEALAELHRRGVVRSNNAPAGDYGEWLAARALGGTLVSDFSVKSYDLTTPDGARVQVKTRVVSVPPLRGQLQASAFRSWDFEQAALMLLRDHDYQVHRAVLVPVAVIQANSSRVEHVNGWRLLMTPAVLDHPEAVDFTEAARSAAEEA